MAFTNFVGDMRNALTKEAGGFNSYSDSTPRALPDYELRELSGLELFQYRQGQCIGFSEIDILNNVDVTCMDPRAPRPPKAIRSFKEIEISKQITANLKRSQYIIPTPVQAHAIPAILKDRDVMGCAPTGSGKTVAFLLPIVEQMMKLPKTQPSLSKPLCPRAVIISPTRELSEQTYNECRKLTYGTDIKPLAIFGGLQNMGDQVKRMTNGRNVLCCTTGRLIDLYGRKQISFARCQFIVLDEADMMLSLGFEQSVEYLLNSTDLRGVENRMNMMFSATFPDSVQRLAQKFLKPNYIVVAVAVAKGQHSDKTITAINANITQRLVKVTGNRREALLDLLDNDIEMHGKVRKTLVFANTRKTVASLAFYLYSHDYDAVAIYGGQKSQAERTEALHDFSTDHCDILVATNVAARGLDIPHVDHVINYELPSDRQQYVHRIGRTGRIGNHGNATSLFDKLDDESKKEWLLAVFADFHQTVPNWMTKRGPNYIKRRFGQGMAWAIGLKKKAQELNLNMTKSIMLKETLIEFSVQKQINNNKPVN